MPRLSTSDLEATLGFLAEANAVEGPEPFPQTLLASFRHLIPCDQASYCELDRVRKDTLWLVEDPVFDSPEVDVEVYWRLRHEHPTCHYEDETGDFRPMKISDLVSMAELRRREIYWEWFRPYGVEYELGVGLDAPLTHTKVFIFDRGGTTDFSERDRAVLEVLRPHLPRLYEAARARRRAREALALLERTDSAVVVLNGRDGIEYATPQAERLLSAYFGRGDAGLPEPLAEWLPNQRRSDAPEPLKVSGDGGLLLVHLVDGSLLLEEQRSTPLLTEREREILELVAEGKTNAEIAEAIWIAPGTVRKHLENIYEKLGVHSRTAAVAALNGDA